MHQEVATSQRLDSPIYGSLVHVTEVISLTLKADIAAGKIFGLSKSTLNSYVSCSKLNSSENVFNDLQSWPHDENSLFDIFRNNQIKHGIHHLSDLVELLRNTNNRNKLFDRINKYSQVRDAICISLHLSNATSAKIVLIRCNHSQPFAKEDLQILDRLKISITRSLQVGLDLYINTLSPNKPELTNNTTSKQKHDSTSHLSRLSNTERIVFKYLRTHHTEREIASLMSRSRHTIHVYVKNIYNKLNISSRRDLQQTYQDIELPWGN